MDKCSALKTKIYYLLNHIIFKNIYLKIIALPLDVLKCTILETFIIYTT